jgi:hypothetical protein
MQAIQLGVIVFDAGTQVREAINEDVVTSYAECMERGDQFPPVVLFHDGNAYYLGDGFHRALAAKRNGRAGISADVRGGTKTDALWFALGANKTNGQLLTQADKKHAIVLALKHWPDKSAKVIAEQVGATAKYVGDIRDRVMDSLNLPERVTGKDGKSYPANYPQAQAAKDAKRAEIAQCLQAGKTSRDIVKSLRVQPELVAEVRRQLGAVVDKSRESVAQRRKDIRDMAECGCTSRQIAASLGIHQDTVGAIARKEGVVIHADRVVGATRHHDANRIVGQMVMDAENLTADVGLIDFPALDPAQLGAWIASLTQSRQSLNSFIRRLARERRNHGQAEGHT